MPTGYYLLDNRNTTVQYRHPRRARLSGMVAVHTSEGVMDDVGIDTGAENVAGFIVRRSDYGSYHVIVDSDSTVRMAPDDYETWHVGADGHNWHAWGISAACRTVDWNPRSAWTQLTIRRMGAEIAAFWQRNGFDVEALAGRWLTIEQARRHEPGLIEHGTCQPADRSDAWATRSDRAELRQMLTDAILAAHRGANPPIYPGDWFDMATKQDLQDVSDAAATRILEAVAQWEKDTRAALRGFPVAMVDGHRPDGTDGKSLWLIVDDGERRRHIKDVPRLELLREFGIASKLPERYLPATVWKDGDPAKGAIDNPAYLSFIDLPVDTVEA